MLTLGWRFSFSALQRAENSSIRLRNLFSAYLPKVSVLFSEPKIPQSMVASRVTSAMICFSALQRAENSSIFFIWIWEIWQFQFQCSSASRKFLNRRRECFTHNPSEVSVLFSEPKIPQCVCVRWCAAHRRGFSALQRAENSSICMHIVAQFCQTKFQCSSASRKFLNRCHQRRTDSRIWVSVLFSEPKIPQYFLPWSRT